jgi:hypothetical protein
MAFQIAGFTSANVAEVSGTTFRALRVQAMPVDYGSLGIYRFSWLSGTMAAGLAANSPIWSFRWGDATRLAVFQKLIGDGMAGSSTAFAAGFASFKAFFARSFTASDTGGAILTITGNNGKLRTSMGTTLLTEIRASTTATLTAGTRTLDAQPLAQHAFSIGTVVSVIYIPPATPLFNEDVVGTMPIVLAQNEGVVVQATVPATGTWQIGLTSMHAEVTAY